jgi:hypothetical protein
LDLFGQSGPAFRTHDKCPELSPVENVWLYMRDNWLLDRIFKSYHDLVDHCCEAWNKLVDQPWRIVSLGLRALFTGENGALPRHFADMAFSLCAELTMEALFLSPVSEGFFSCLVFDVCGPGNSSRAAERRPRSNTAQLKCDSL